MKCNARGNSPVPSAPKRARNRRRICRCSLLAGASKASSSEPWEEIVVGATHEDANPEHQFRTIDDHTKDVQGGLENNRDEREDIAERVDANEDEGNAADGAVNIDVDVVSQDAGCQQCSGCHGH